MILRPYQREAIDAVAAALAEPDRHPLVSLPTAAGKTIIFASMLKEWMNEHPFRACIAAHRAELLSQAEAKIMRVWPEASVGVYSAQLKRRQLDKKITIAGIASVYKRAFDCYPFDLIIIDEAHLVPFDTGTMYRKFLDDCRIANPNVRIVGFTATPYRLDGGDIAGQSDSIFTDICYTGDIARMIRDGYLCGLTTKAGRVDIDTSKVGTSGGDFKPGELEEAADLDEIVVPAVAEIVERGRDRSSWLVFTTGVKHAQHVAREFAKHGITAEVVIGTTDHAERTKTLADFDSGKLRCVVNVNCLTTGLDVTRIDLIAVLRPTKSTSLWVQMVGRGFRLHEGKKDCLILDYGENALRHGPLDALRIKPVDRDAEGAAPVKKCPQCQELVPASASECAACGHVFPPKKISHQQEADATPIIGLAKPRWLKVRRVCCRKHISRVGATTLAVHYYCGLECFREWICLDHDGYARRQAERWWRQRGLGVPPVSVAEAMLIAGLNEKLQESVGEIQVAHDPTNTKYMRVIGHRKGSPELRGDGVEGVSAPADEQGAVSGVAGVQ